MNHSKLLIIATKKLKLFIMDKQINEQIKKENNGSL